MLLELTTPLLQNQPISWASAILDRAMHHVAAGFTRGSIVACAVVALKRMMSSIRMKLRGVYRGARNFSGWEDYNFVFESKEQNDPEKYGKRLPGRRFCLLLAVVCVAVYLFQAFHTDLHESPQQRVATMISDFDQNLTWPTNGTDFDNVFKAYGTAALRSDYVCIVGWAALLVALFVESIIRHDGLAVSQAFTFLSGALLFLGIILPGFENYLVDLGFDQFFPMCAQGFNAFVNHAIRNGVSHTNPLRTLYRADACCNSLL
jgi:hypothetical protein